MQVACHGHGPHLGCCLKNSIVLKASKPSHLFGTCFQQPARMVAASVTGMSCPPQWPHLLRTKHGYLISWALGTDWGRLVLLSELAFLPMGLPSAGPVISVCFFVERSWLVDIRSDASWASVWAQALPIFLSCGEVQCPQPRLWKVSFISVPSYLGYHRQII